MGWNHRVIRHEVPDSSPKLAIHEVYYDDDGNPTMVTVEPVGVRGDSLEDMEEILRWMLKALDKPILDMKDFEKGGKYYDD